MSFTRLKNPVSVIDPILSQRILQHSYWKEECYGLNEAGVAEKALSLSYIGGSYSIYLKPTPFLCLLYKLLQLNPVPEIILNLFHQNKYKYIRALAMFYIRLVFKPQFVYTLLDQMYMDYRKLRVRYPHGWEVTHVDEYTHGLLNARRMFDVTLPYLPLRANVGVPPRVSPLEEILTAEECQEALGKLVVEMKEEVFEVEGDGSLSDEIRRENALRASLGLKPLKD
ncbi:hypothetical protein GEMRC1_002626 [Eukaryota sp. GEM-RC1]